MRDQHSLVVHCRDFAYNLSELLLFCRLFVVSVALFITFDPSVVNLFPNYFFDSNEPFKTGFFVDGCNSKNASWTLTQIACLIFVPIQWFLVSDDVFKVIGKESLEIGLSFIILWLSLLFSY